MSIKTLIEQDLQKLQEANQEVVDDDGNGDWRENDSSSDVEEVENVEEPEKAEGDAEKAEGDAEKAEGDAENQGPPGSDYQVEEDEDYFDDESMDPIILGVRIYTKGGVAVSVTGHVVGEGVDEDEDEDKDAEAEDEDEDKNLKKTTKEKAKKKD